MTKTKLVVALLLSGVLGGAVGAATMTALAKRGDPAVEKERLRKDDAGEATLDDEADSDDGSERILRLEAELRTLQRATKTNQSLAEYSQALKKKREAKNGDELDDELAPVVDGEDPTFELAVRTVMDRVEWEKQEERRVTEDRRSEERAERQTELLAGRLGLTGVQRPKLQSILTEQMGAFRNLRSADSGVPRPTTRSEWRAQVDKIRGETEAKLAEVLDDKQLGLYKEWVAEEGWGRARGRRGGDNADGDNR
jgi:hypothetical protein